MRNDCLCGIKHKAYETYKPWYINTTTAAPLPCHPVKIRRNLVRFISRQSLSLILLRNPVKYFGFEVIRNYTPNMHETTDNCLYEISLMVGNADYYGEKQRYDAH